MRTWKTLAGLIVVASTASCGDVARQGRSSNFLVIDSLTATRGGGTSTTSQNVLLSDVLTNVTQPAPCTATSPCPTVFDDMGTVTLRLSPKDVGTVGIGNTPSTNNQVTINRYHITYRRTDGRNVPGTDVPYAWDGAATGTVQIGSPLPLGFEAVRHVAKQEPPLVQLISSSTIITTIADITFYGRDQVGNDISVTGSMQIDFGNFGDF